MQKVNALGKELSHGDDINALGIAVLFYCTFYISVTFLHLIIYIRFCCKKAVTPLTSIPTRNSCLKCHDTIIIILLHSCIGSPPIGGQGCGIPASYWLKTHSHSLSSSDLAAASNTNSNLSTTTPCERACPLCNRLFVTHIGREKDRKVLFFGKRSLES